MVQESIPYHNKKGKAQTIFCSAQHSTLSSSWNTYLLQSKNCRHPFYHLRLRNPKSFLTAFKVFFSPGQRIKPAFTRDARTTYIFFIIPMYKSPPNIANRSAVIITGEIYSSEPVMKKNYKNSKKKTTTEVAVFLKKTLHLQ